MAAGAGLGAIGGRSAAQRGAGGSDATRSPPAAQSEAAQRADDETAVLYTYRKRRALEVLLSDPEVHAAAADMISSYEAYEPLANRDTVSVQGCPDVEIEGGLEEGRFDVTALERQVAYGHVDRGTDDLVALTITEPQDVAWRAWEATDFESEQLARVLEDSRVQAAVDGADWFPLFTVSEAITSARGIEHGGVNPVVLFVADGDATRAVVAYVDIRDGKVGDVVDVSTVERFAEYPPHELAASLEPAEETVLDAVSGVPFERRPWYTADDGSHRTEDPPQSFDRDDWTIDWEPPGTHGAEITASYRGTPVFERLESPVTFTGYGLPERDGESTLEWFFPDDEPVFSGELLRWDVHSLEFGGPGPLGIVEYDDADDRPSGFRFRSHYETGAQAPDGQDHHSGYRFGQSSHELAYDFWADGVVTPVWKRQGPGFSTEYAAPAVGDADDDEDGATADTDDTDAADVADGEEPEYAVAHHSISAIAMDPVPGTTDSVAVEVVDETGRSAPETEFYLVGTPDTVVRLRNPEGSETIELPLEDGTEVVVARRAAGEIPQQQRLEEPSVESAFYHPAQYIGDEPIQGERVIVWLLREAPTAALPHSTGTTSFVAQSAITLSGY
ncbi:hypothetical protein ATJ93_0290 [Halopiger aswanensis]|uniref:Uncharacterized protein n=1 Tax=Halopiger aswanensis TaxID=148449 RepID=A0A3R7DEP0_9EURY|nr:hypothetical protein ATJ93_0290 [Halopiger aswanensis]